MPVVVLLLLLLHPSVLAAQRPASPPVADVAFSVTFDSARAASRTIRVEMAFTTPGAESIVLSLPRWTPGSYELTEFARYVRGFEAVGPEGRPLRWSRADPHSWRVHPEGSGRISVRYDVLADSLDTGMAWTTDDLAMFNGTALFLYPGGTVTAASAERGAATLDFTSRVRVHTEPGWRIATGMRAVQGREYEAADYHELVDMPFLIGRFDLDSARIVDRWFRLATYPEGVLAGPPRALVWEQLRRMVPPMVQVWREIPFDSYTILQVAHASVGGASGLEHSNSHLNVISPFAIGHPFLPSLYAHEIFHAWNVKRLRPAELWPYRYDRPQWTPLLWMSEGVTDYYADLALVRGGVITRTGFLRTTADKIQEVMNTPAVALEDASIATWVQPRDGTALVYYPKGSVAGLLLDIMLRDATANRISLDSVMRDLYRTRYGAGEGFTSDDWWNAIGRAAGGGTAAGAFSEFRTRYVAGRESMPFAAVLARGGLRMLVDTIREPVVGVRTVLDGEGVLVTGVEPGGAASEAGVRPGDYLLTVGTLRVTDRDFPERFRQGWAGRDGTPLPLRVRRAGRQLELTGTVRLATRYEVRLEEDRAAPPAAIRVREGVLRGLVAP